MIKELLSLVKLNKIIKFSNPSIIFAYTFKSIIYSSILKKRSNKIYFVSLITGLGYVFFERSLIKSILKNILIFLFKFSLNKSNVIIFQNRDNLRYFNINNICNTNQKKIIRGSGVDTNFFNYKLPPKLPVKFIMISRLLKEKGVIEYLRAAEIVKNKYPSAKFTLVGDFDTSFDTIDKKDLDFFVNKKIIQYLGYKENIKKLISESHVLVLPSYHEGMPRAVLEAMSIGRPIITSDAPGCRETVINKENGFLVGIKDYIMLAEKITWFIENNDKIKNMGIKSRQLAENIFDSKIINKNFLDILNERR